MAWILYGDHGNNTARPGFPAATTELGAPLTPHRSRVLERSSASARFATAAWPRTSTDRHAVRVVGPHDGQAAANGARGRVSLPSAQCASRRSLGETHHRMPGNRPAFFGEPIRPATEAVLTMLPRQVAQCCRTHAITPRPSSPPRTAGRLAWPPFAQHAPVARPGVG
jgi:hypothetical protein